MQEKLERDGYAGLADRRKGEASSHRVPPLLAEEVLRLYRERYSDFSTAVIARVPYGAWRTL
jgi:hypothetical protein